MTPDEFFESNCARARFLYEQDGYHAPVILARCPSTVIVFDFKPILDMPRPLWLAGAQALHAMFVKQGVTDYLTISEGWGAEVDMGIDLATVVPPREREHKFEVLQVAYDSATVQFGKIFSISQGKVYALWNDYDSRKNPGPRSRGLFQNLTHPDWKDLLP